MYVLPGRILRYFMILLYAIPFLSTVSVCQENPAPDDSTMARKHSPTKAIIMSAIMPGLGQVYNQKIWKVPILYAGEITALYYFQWNQVRYQEILQILKDGAGEEYYYVYGRKVYEYQLERARDHYRRQRDYSALFFIGIYALNIIDALVDAHFYEYDISDDLSLKIRPAYFTPDIRQGGFGLNVCLRF